MSEPSSLYARIHLSKSALAAYQAATPDLPSQYTDWLPWLAERQFHGNITEAGIQELNHGKISSVQDAISAWTDYPELDLGQSHYDPESQSWTLGFLECSENYYDYMLVLSLLRGIARFKDLPGEDFILITPYIWGGPPDAYIVVEQGSSSLNSEIPESIVEEANAGLKKLFDAMANHFGDREL